MERELELVLVARLRTGDPAAFDAVYDFWNARLFRFLVRMAKNRVVAEDLTEETWLRLVSAGEHLHAGTCLGPWLFTVARNLFLSYCRSRAREESYTRDLINLWPEAPSRSPFDQVFSNEVETILDSALVDLPPIYREALLLVGVECLRPTEAAAVCGISAESFRQRLSRARALLARRLNEKGLPLELVNKEVGV